MKRGLVMNPAYQLTVIGNNCALLAAADGCRNVVIYMETAWQQKSISCSPNREVAVSAILGLSRKKLKLVVKVHVKLSPSYIKCRLIRKLPLC